MVEKKQTNEQLDESGKDEDKKMDTEKEEEESVQVNSAADKEENLKHDDIIRKESGLEKLQSNKEELYGEDSSAEGEKQDRTHLID